MKRSEMVDIIDKLIKLKEEIVGTPLTANQILFEIEKAGMLPPSYWNFEPENNIEEFVKGKWEQDDET